MRALIAIVLALAASIPVWANESPPIDRTVLTMRDPFRIPEIAAKQSEPLTELQLHPIHEYRLTGVITGPKRIRGMIVAPDGKTHFVSKGDKIGNKRGFISEITPKKVVVQEYVVNVMGEEEVSHAELKVPEGAGGN